MIKCKARTNVLIISKPIISAQRALNGFLTPEMGSPYQSAYIEKKDLIKTRQNVSV